MKKHTPGPWAIVTGQGWRNAAIRPIVMGQQSQHTLARILPNDDCEANARLIAAAPELLEALKGLLADISDYQTTNNLGGQRNHWQVIARAAIAKAESVK